MTNPVDTSAAAVEAHAKTLERALLPESAKVLRALAADRSAAVQRAEGMRGALTDSAEIHSLNVGALELLKVAIEEGDPQKEINARIRWLSEDAAKAANRARDAIGEAQSDPVTGWHPVATAPKDGKAVDLWVEHTDCLGKSTSMRYADSVFDGTLWLDKWGNYLEWQVAPDEVEEGCSPLEGRKVTHWMRVAPPSDPARAAEEK